MATYTIRRRDTFYKLAQQWGTTVAAIQAANPGVNPNTLRVGQVINEPGSGPPPPPPPPGNYTFQDEFDGPAGSAPNSSLWTLLSEPQSGENPGAVGTYSPGNCFLDGNSNLVIRAASKTSSGRMHTQGKFEQQYGTFEAKIKFAQNAGSWPSWWMIGDTYPDMGEIDMWEAYGNAWGPSTTVYDNAGNNNSAINVAAMQDGNWHIWKMVWTKGAGMKFYQDGAQYFSVAPSAVSPWPYDNAGNKLYMIINQTLGGTGGGSSFGSFPHDLLCDYIRVSK